MSYSNFTFMKNNKTSSSTIDRNNKQSDKFNTSIEVVQNSKYEFLKNKIENVDDNLDSIIAQSNHKFSLIKDNILKIQNYIDEEYILSENLLNEKTNYIKQLESKIFERFNKEQQIREEIGKKVLTLIDDKFNGLKIDVTKESKNRYESIENLKNYLENDVPKLNGIIKSEEIRREEKDDEITIKILEEFSNLQNEIQSERKVREETEEAILDTLRVMVTKTKSDIQSERNQRESTEESLLSLLEETCQKLSAVPN